METTLGHTRIHLHSILVHSVIALVIVSAGSFLLVVSGAHVGRLGPDLWTFLLRGSLVGALLVSLPAIATGVTDRSHMYATWHRSHRAKLVLSIALAVLVAVALYLVFQGPLQLLSWPGATLAASVLVVLALAWFGLRITLGRQAWARTSYVSDMWKTPPVDILETVAAAAAEHPKLIDPHEEDAA